MDLQNKEESPQLVKDNKSKEGMSRTTRFLFAILIFSILLAAVVLLVQQVQRSQDTRSNADQNQAENRALGKPVIEEVSGVITIISPSSGEVLQDPIKIEAQVSNSITPQRVEFWKSNEKEPFYIAEEGPYSAVVSDLHPGSLTFYVKAFDSDGNGHVSRDVTIRIEPTSQAPQGRGEKE